MKRYLEEVEDFIEAKKNGTKILIEQKLFMKDQWYVDEWYIVFCDGVPCVFSTYTEKMVEYNTNIYPNSNRRYFVEEQEWK